MIDLNNPDEIKKFDPKDVLGSTGFLIDQTKQIHSLIQSQEFNINQDQIKNIVFSGMGGSAYGGQVAIHLFKNNLKVPVYINNDYTLPDFVNLNSLVILTSYSGNTEETLQSLQEAKTRGAQMIALTSGGKLAQDMQSLAIPVVVFDPKYNPSGQPRLGTGYIVLGTIEILQKLGLINLSLEEVEKAISDLEKNQQQIQDLAKNMAAKVFGKIPAIFAANFLGGNAHILRNQFNETAKSFATYNLLPELNHHAMEGLKNPLDKKLVVLMIDSNFYPQIIQKRAALTQEVVEKNNVEVLKYQPQGSNEIAQVFDLLLFGGYLSFYLAILYKQDPSVIPWVDYFKEKLAS